MKKLALIIFALLLTTNCFALDMTMVTRTSTPWGGGDHFIASTTVVDAAYRQMQLGSDAICSVTFSVPVGEIYIGGTDVKTNSLTLAATQSALTLNLTTMAGLYVTGRNGIKVNVFKIY